MLHPNVEASLVSLLLEELALMRSMNAVRHALSLQPDWSAMRGFKQLDIENTGVVTHDQLISWLSYNGHHASEEEIISIIRRIDLDQDAVLNFHEFEKSLQQQKPTEAFYTEYETRIKENRPTEESRRDLEKRVMSKSKDAINISTSPLRKSVSPIKGTVYTEPAIDTTVQR